MRGSAPAPFQAMMTSPVLIAARAGVAEVRRSVRDSGRVQTPPLTDQAQEMWSSLALCQAAWRTLPSETSAGCVLAAAKGIWPLSCHRNCPLVVWSSPWSQ